MGVAIERQPGRVTIVPTNRSLQSGDWTVVSDFSSAAFFIVAASLVPHSDITLPRVGINPGRCGLLAVLEKMGTNIQLSHYHAISGEPVADIRVRSVTSLFPVTVSPREVPGLIDEFPILCIAAACAKGTSHFLGIEELRVKESDRIEAMRVGLKKLGIETEYSTPEGLSITGGRFSGGRVDSFGDHRIAMSFIIAGAVAKNPVQVYDCSSITTSFPNFIEMANSLGLVTCTK